MTKPTSALPVAVLLGALGFGLAVNAQTTSSESDTTAQAAATTLTNPSDVSSEAALAAPDRAPVVAAPQIRQKLPSLLDPEVADWLKRGDYQRALIRCELELRALPLVTEPGTLAPFHQCAGEAFYGLQNYAEAVKSFDQAKSDLESASSVFDPRLVEPLEGIGKALMGLGQFEAAEEALTQAKDITHRNFGIYNLVQTPIVNRLTRSYLNQGELTKATREQNFLLRANEDTYGEAPQLLPALRRAAKWQERIGRPDLARNTYRRAMAIMERAYGPDDLRLVGPLRDFAQSYVNTPRGADRVMSRSGARALQDIAELYERQPFSDAIDVARAWAELGDWFVIGGRRGLARDAYAKAGLALQQASVEGGDLFAEPLEIEYEELPISIRPSRLSSLPEGVALIIFEFTVTDTGRVHDLTVVRDDLDYPRFALEVAQSVKASRYRPRLVDGVPVDTPGVRKTLRYDFTRRLVQSSDADATTESQAAEASEEAAPPAVETPDQPESGREADDDTGPAEGEDQTRTP